MAGSVNRAEAAGHWREATRPFGMMILIFIDWRRWPCACFDVVGDAVEPFAGDGSEWSAPNQAQNALAVVGPLSWASAEEGEDVLGRAGFAEHGEDVADGVVVRGGVEVGHGVGDQRDVEAVLVGLAGGRFDADAGRDAADDDLGDAEF